MFAFWMTFLWALQKVCSLFLFRRKTLDKPQTDKQTAWRRPFLGVSCHISRSQWTKHMVKCLVITPPFSRSLWLSLPKGQHLWGSTHFWSVYLCQFTYKAILRYKPIRFPSETSGQMVKYTIGNMKTSLLQWHPPMATPRLLALPSDHLPGLLWQNGTSPSVPLPGNYGKKNPPNGRGQQITIQQTTEMKGNKMHLPKWKGLPPSSH